MSTAAGDRRRRLAALTALVTGTFVALLSLGSSSVPVQESRYAPDIGLCCNEIVAAPRPVATQDTQVEPVTRVMGRTVPALNVRVVSPLLPAGVAPERGLQVRTILAARSISDAFPEIHSIGGVRPDALQWHPNGLALDVMIPQPDSPEGIALGDRIAAYALENARRFGLQDVIWRGVYYTPDGAKSGSYGHFDHVHVTTHGGGYPTGEELYYR